MIRHKTRIGLAFVGAASLLHVASASAVVVDTFTRADGGTATNSIGTTEVGGLVYDERVAGGQNASDVNAASIVDGRLHIHGVGTNGEGLVYLSGYDSADVTVSFVAEFTSNIATPVYGTSTARNTLSVFLRADDSDLLFGNGAANDVNSGLIGIEMTNSGGLFIRQRLAAGTLGTVNYTNSFTGTSAGGIYQYTAGALGTTLNGLPFDLDDDGQLEAGESFLFTASLSGTTLTVSLNNQVIFSGAVEQSSGNGVNGVALRKGRPGSFTVFSDIYIDNLDISPITIPEPASLGLLGVGALAMLRRRK